MIPAIVLGVLTLVFVAWTVHSIWSESKREAERSRSQGTQRPTAARVASHYRNGSRPVVAPADTGIDPAILLLLSNPHWTGEPARVSPAPGSENTHQVHEPPSYTCEAPDGGVASVDSGSFSSCGSSSSCGGGGGGD